jgi:phosphoribosylformylglycinamidine (FGAM) synthase-like enzyme
VDLISAGLPAECVLFAEDATRVLVTCDATKVRTIEETAVKYGLNAQAIGKTTSQNLRIRIDGITVIEGEVSAFQQSWRKALESALQTEL